jgi:hypothetical protein
VRLVAVARSPDHRIATTDRHRSRQHVEHGHMSGRIRGSGGQGPGGAPIGVRHLAPRLRRLSRPPCPRPRRRWPGRCACIGRCRRRRAGRAGRHDREGAGHLRVDPAMEDIGAWGAVTVTTNGAGGPARGAPMLTIRAVEHARVPGGAAALDGSRQGPGTLKMAWWFLFAPSAVSSMSAAMSPWTRCRPPRPRRGSNVAVWKPSLVN